MAWMSTTDVLITSVLHAGVAVGVGIGLDRIITPAAVTKDGAYLTKSPVREALEVVAQFLLSIWGTRELMDLLLPGGEYLSPISDALANVLLFLFQRRWQDKTMRLFDTMFGQFGPSKPELELAQ